MVVLVSLVKSRLKFSGEKKSFDTHARACFELSTEGLLFYARLSFSYGSFWFLQRTSFLRKAPLSTEGFGFYREAFV